MIICGDALTELRKLPDESVHCCVTSPPYWGLRDYGTAKWEGGDQDCKHIKAMYLKRDNSGGLAPISPTAIGPLGTRGNQSSTKSSVIQFSGTCPKCGAIRIDAQLGLEKTPEEYVAHLVEVFREVKRVLRKDGTLWLNLGDSYWGSGCGPSGNFGVPDEVCVNNSKGKTYETHNILKSKDLVGIPWRMAFALQADGWWLRSDIIWAKPNPMPESVKDRPTRSHEYIFLMSKSARYYFNQEAVKEKSVQGDKIHTISENSHFRKARNPGGAIPIQRESYQAKSICNIRSVWTITIKPMPKVFGQEHFATFPPELPERCIKAGCPVGGVVLDPFFGAGTVGLVAKQLGRDFIGIELNQKYCEMAERRIAQVGYQIPIPLERRHVEEMVSPKVSEED